MPAPQSARRPEIDAKPWFVAFLANSLLIVILAVQTSDVATIRLREQSGIAGFEYPVLARALYVVERTFAPSRSGIALVNAVLGVAAAVAVARFLRLQGGDAALWMSSPTLLLAGVNIDAVTALLIVLALRSWSRANMTQAGVLIGLGVAFKLVPIVLLFPIAGDSNRRGLARLLAAAASTWVAANLPYAVAFPDAWRFPYEFAAVRPPGSDTLWAVLGLSVRATNVGSTLALGVLGTSIALGVWRRKISRETGVALALLAMLATSKLWQPHYLLWALPALSLAWAPTGLVRVLEVANLVCFVLLWLQLPEPTASLWLSSVGAIRIAALVLIAVVLIRRDTSRRRLGPDAERAVTAPEAGR